MKRVKRLLIVTDTFLPVYDGTTVLLNFLLPVLSKYYKITVLAPHYDLSKNPYPKTTLIKIPLFGRKMIDVGIPKLRQAIVHTYVENADIVLVLPLGPIGFLAALDASRLGKKLIFATQCIEHELLPEYLGMRQPFKAATQFIVSRFMRALYNKCDLIIIPAAAAIKDMRKRGIRPRIVAIPLGIDIKKYKPTHNKEHAKARLGLKGVVIGYYGRIAREKNLATLFEAFAQLKKKYGDLNLLIVSPPTKLKVQKILGMKHVMISYKGKMPNVVPYLQAMDIYVLPSLTETISLSAIEAMACGVPVASTNAGWMPELINKSNGVIFEKRNVDELTKKLEQLIKNKKIRQKLGNEARKTIVRGYNLRDVVEKLKQSIDRI